MTDTPSVFDQQKPVLDKDGNVVQNHSDNYDAVLDGLKDANGNRMYNSVDDLIKGVLNKESHIKTVEAENLTLRQNAGSNKTIEDVLAALKKEATPVAPVVTPTDANPVTIEDVKTMVEKAIGGAMTQHDINKVSTVNLKEFDAILAKQFGEKAGATFQEKAAEFGYDVQWLKQSAAMNPKNTLALLGITVEPTTTELNLSSAINPGAQPPGQTVTEIPKGATREQKMAIIKADTIRRLKSQGQI